MASEAEWVAGGTGINDEHLIAVGIIGWSPCVLKLTPSELNRQPSGRLQVVYVQVEMHLLLLGTRRPVRCHMVWGMLYPHDPVAVDSNAVPVRVAVHLAAQDGGPESALGLDIVGVEYNDPSDDLHVSSCLRPNGMSDHTVGYASSMPQQKPTSTDLRPSRREFIDDVMVEQVPALLSYMIRLMPGNETWAEDDCVRNSFASVAAFWRVEPDPVTPFPGLWRKDGGLRRVGLYRGRFYVILAPVPQ
jgi:hypothetical protein